MLGLERAKECNGWLRIMNVCKKTTKEIDRTLEKKLRKNIDSIIFSFRNRRTQEILDYCTDEFEIFSLAIRFDKTKPEIFLRMVKNAQLNCFDVTSVYHCKILDSIQAHRPFYQDLFKMIMEFNHERWTDIVKTFYNKRFKDLSVGPSHPGTRHPPDCRSHHHTA